MVKFDWIALEYVLPFASLMSAVVVICVTVLIEKRGGVIGGVLGMIPSTVVVSAIGLIAFFFREFLTKNSKHSNRSCSGKQHRGFGGNFIYCSFGNDCIYFIFIYVEDYSTKIAKILCLFEINCDDS